MNDVQFDVVEHFKYLGSLKPANGNCNSDIKSRIGMAKKIMFDMILIWRDIGINKDKQIAVHWTIIIIVHSLARTVLI